MRNMTARHFWRRLGVFRYPILTFLCSKIKNPFVWRLTGRTLSVPGVVYDYTLLITSPNVAQKIFWEHWNRLIDVIRNSVFGLVLKKYRIAELQTKITFDVTQIAFRTGSQDYWTAATSTVQTNGVWLTKSRCPQTA